MNIYPAILSDDPEQIDEQLALAAQISSVEVIQFDIVDGYFADSLTLSPADLGQFDFAGKQIDLHLMTVDPIDAVYETMEYRNELPVRAVIGQVERMGSQNHFVEEVAKQHWLPGLSLSLYTPLSEIDQDCWKYLRVLQLMGMSETGYQNQGFSFAVLEKIKQAREFIKSQDHLVEIIVDGGVKLDNVPAIQAAGADSISVGSGLWQAEDFAARFQEYQEKMKEQVS